MRAGRRAFTWLVSLLHTARAARPRGHGSSLVGSHRPSSPTLGSAPKTQTPRLRASFKRCLQSGNSGPCPPVQNLSPSLTPATAARRRLGSGRAPRTAPRAAARAAPAACRDPVRVPGLARRSRQHPEGRRDPAAVPSRPVAAPRRPEPNPAAPPPRPRREGPPRPARLGPRLPGEKPGGEGRAQRPAAAEGGRRPRPRSRRCPCAAPGHRAHLPARPRRGAGATHLPALPDRTCAASGPGRAAFLAGPAGHGAALR